MVSTITAGLELHSRLLVVLSREQRWHLLWRELSHGDRRTCRVLMEVENRPRWRWRTSPDG